MERFVLEVDDSVGEVYNKLDEESKRLFSQVVSLMIKKAVNDATFEDYTRLLDRMGEEVAKNGLTAEILESHLASH